MEEEAERAWADGEALLEALRDDGAHGGLGAGARAAVVVLPQLRPRGPGDAQRQDGDREHQEAAGSRHCLPSIASELSELGPLPSVRRRLRVTDTGCARGDGALERGEKLPWFYRRGLGGGGGYKCARSRAGHSVARKKMQGWHGAMDSAVWGRRNITAGIERVVAQSRRRGGDGNTFFPFPVTDALFFSGLVQ